MSWGWISAGAENAVMRGIGVIRPLCRVSWTKSLWCFLTPLLVIEVWVNFIWSTSLSQLQQTLFIVLCCFQLDEESTTLFLPFYCRNAFRNTFSPPKQELSDLELLCRKLDPLLAFKVQQTWINTNEITILGHLGSGGLNWDWHWHYILSVMVIKSFIASKCLSFILGFRQFWDCVVRSSQNGCFLSHQCCSKKDKRHMFFPQPLNQCYSNCGKTVFLFVFSVFLFFVGSTKDNFVGRVRKNKADDKLEFLVQKVEGETLLCKVPLGRSTMCWCSIWQGGWNVPCPFPSTPFPSPNTLPHPNPP